MVDLSTNKQKSQPPKSAVLRAYEAHFSALKRFVTRMLTSHHDVDDVMQEAFLRAYVVDSEKPIEQPKSYLFRVARNVAINQLRQKKRKPTDYLEDIDSSHETVADFTLEDELMAQQKLGIHCAAVSSLPPKCRKVYLLRKVYGMSYKDIAETLNITVSTVETHIEKGFARCDAYVEKHLKDHDDHQPMKAVVRGDG